jgi:hypothetical protein
MFRAAVLLANVDELNNSLGKYAPMANLSIVAFVLIGGGIFAFWFVRKGWPSALNSFTTEMKEQREAHEERMDTFMTQSWANFKDARDWHERQVNRQIDHCHAVHQQNQGRGNA